MSPAPTRLTCTKVWYKSLQDFLARLLPGCEVEIQTYTVGIRGLHDPDYGGSKNSDETVALAERLMQDMVEQARTELTDIYSVLYAALQHVQHA